MTLVILAAGMGSRYGGLKQIDPIGPCGEFIIDYSCHDAILAGFDRIVFIIKKENEKIFRETVGSRVEKHIRVEYVFQDPAFLPEGFSVPEGRIKPWGTAHAILCARPVLNDCFATVNADDFYGKRSFEIVADFLKNVDPEALPATCCMAAYRLENTLTENGSVSRGVCATGTGGELLSITERTKIFKRPDGAEYEEAGNRYFLPGDTPVSMNFFGISPAVFSFAESAFADFLRGMPDPLKSEFYLPTVLSAAMEAGNARIKLLNTPERWFGVTYSSDREPVRQGIRALVSEGVYKEDLWSDIR